MNKFSRVKASNKQMRNPFGELSIFYKLLNPTGYGLVDERCMDKLEYKTNNCLLNIRVSVPSVQDCLTDHQTHTANPAT